MRKRAGAVWRKVALPILLLAALALPTQTRNFELTKDAENALHDTYRYLLAPNIGVTADPDIVLLIYDDLVARQAQRTSPVDRALLASALQAVDRADAKAIGIDMAFIQETADQDALTEALAAISTPTYIVYADPEGDRATYWDRTIDADARRYQDEFWAKIAAGNVHKVSPVVGTDDAGVARHWPVLDGSANPLFADAIANANAKVSAADRPYGGAITYTKVAAKDVAEVEADVEQGWGMFPRIQIDLVADELFGEDFLPLLQGKYVLIGVDTFNSDQLTTPITRVAGTSRVAGVTVHAQMLRQALDRNFPITLPIWSILALTALFIAAGMATARIERQPIKLMAAIAVQAALALSMPVGLHAAGVDILTLPLLGLALAWLIAFLAAGYALRTRSSTERAFARGALGKFLPSSVAREILDHPEKLELEGEERELFLMFTDLQGFTSFSHGREPRETATILNRYLEEMSEIVLAHKGTIDKYVGDAIVAFWGAPIASPDDADNAVACALALKEASESLRERLAAEYGDTLGRTRIGVNYGPVVVGNFGGKKRIQYTAMGDAMNVAARLEGASKYLGTDILVSQAVADRAPNFLYRAIGCIQMSGVGTGVEVFEPLDDTQQDFAERWHGAMGILRSGEAGGDAQMRALAKDYPDDRALAAVINRARFIVDGRPYVLGSK